MSLYTLNDDDVMYDVSFICFYRVSLKYYQLRMHIKSQNFGY